MMNLRETKSIEYIFIGCLFYSTNHIQMVLNGLVFDNNSLNDTSVNISFFLFQRFRLFNPCCNVWLGKCMKVQMWSYILMQLRDYQMHFELEWFAGLVMVSSGRVCFELVLAIYFSFKFTFPCLMGCTPK